MAVTSMKALLEAGVHFGHRTRRWNPKMKPYIFTERNGVHIIDLQQTMTALGNVGALIRDLIAAGGSILFVGTKRQAQETIELEAQRCGMPYVNLRWLGGTLTNWQTIRKRIDYLLNLESRQDRGEFELLTKKEALDLQRQIVKLNNRLGGIKEMHNLPDILYVVDVRRETTAVKEANKLGIPVVAVVDTNCDPDPIDYLIPANDDAIRAIKLITNLMAEAVLEGIALRKAHEPELAEAEEPVEEDEKYLSAATLARLRELSFEEEAEGAEGLPDDVPDEDIPEEMEDKAGDESDAQAAEAVDDAETGVAEEESEETPQEPAEETAEEAPAEEDTEA
jgi:small subunit ribosomal protein S2